MKKHILNLDSVIYGLWKILCNVNPMLKALKLLWNMYLIMITIIISLSIAQTKKKSPTAIQDSRAVQRTNNQRDSRVTG